MSHAHHFLSRLDRVSLPHLELALGLYNDPARLRFLFHDAGLPAQAERIAVSLDHPVRGPFLVVTRYGRFVTCLGEGMSTGDLPILSRAALDGAGVRLAKLRERADALRQAAPTEGASRALLRRIYEAGNDLAREDFIPISALSPLYAGRFLMLMIASGEDLGGARRFLFAGLRRADRWKAIYRDPLRSYWQTLWASAHFGVLSALEGPRLLECFSSDTGRAEFLNLGFWPLTQQGLVGLALRGAWAVARVGKPLLASYKQRYAEATTVPAALDTGIGLFALGAAHASMRAEVRKALAAGPAISGSSIPATFLKHVVAALVIMVDLSPEQARESARAEGRLWAARIARNVAGDVAHRFARPEDVPDTIALSVMANLPIPYLLEGDGIGALLSCVAWVARAAPEELYLPREWIRLVHAPWTPAQTESVLVPLREQFQTPRAPPPRDEPTRNGPCPCKSGKKYKRCCGEAAGVT